MNCPTGMELGEALRNTENSPLSVQWFLPADWYLLPIVSYASSTEILRCAQDDE